MEHDKNTHQDSTTSPDDKQDDLPSINNKLLIKFGGNAMTSTAIQENVIENICALIDNGYQVVVVHGGGPEISKLLDIAGIQSEFIGGHRKTEEDAMAYVEMALKGKVNGELVRLINSQGKLAVGISGKDGRSVKSKKRYHKEMINGASVMHELGFVGDVDEIDTTLIDILLANGYTPVVAPIAFGSDNQNYNINADMFAGNLAAALGVDSFVVLTDVDGLLVDKNDPSTLIKQLRVDEISGEISNSIKGGMIPKIESCVEAVKGGAKQAHIVNGTTRNILKKIFLESNPSGTIIKN
jgi:acetylglutamate kinase